MLIRVGNEHLGDFGRDDMYRAKFKDIIDKCLRGLIDKDVTITIPHSAFSVTLSLREEYPDDFIIEVWSWVNEDHRNNADRYIPTGGDVMMWGHRLPCIDTPSGVYDNEAVFTIYSPEGHPVATLHDRFEEGGKPNTLSIHWDLTHYGRDAELMIFDELMQDVAEILKTGKARVLDLRSIIEKGLKGRIETAKKEYDSAIHSVEYNRAELLNAIRTAEEKQIKYQGVCGSVEEIVEKTVSEIELIKTQYKVIDIKVVGNILEVYTDDIIIETEEYGTHYIGRFKISVSLENTTIRFTNLNNRRDAYWDSSQHPHIDEQGIPCWGSAATTVAMLHGERQYCALVNVLVNYLESVNLDDPAGETIYNWGSTIDSDGYEEETPYYCTNCDCGVRSHDDAIHGRVSEYDVFCSWECRDEYEDREYYTCEDCGDRFDGEEGLYDFDGLYFCCERCRDSFIDSNYTACTNCGGNGS